MIPVDWADEALDSAMEIWMAAGDRNAVSDAIEAIDRELARNAANAGESRPDGQRVTYALPLGVRYEVLDGPPRVRVVACWEVRKRPR